MCLYVSVYCFGLKNYQILVGRHAESLCDNMCTVVTLAGTAFLLPSVRSIDSLTKTT